MAWSDRISPIQVGDTVAYSRQFLQNTGQCTGDAPFARGTVKALVPLGSFVLAEIDWGTDDLPGRVNVKNLSHIKDGRVMDLD